MIVLIIISIVFIALGVLILSGKGDSLIAGYNTASKEEKKQVNIKTASFSYCSDSIFGSAVMYTIAYW